MCNSDQPSRRREAVRAELKPHIRHRHVAAIGSKKRSSHMLHLNTLTTSMVLTNLESFLVCSYVLIDCG